MIACPSLRNSRRFVRMRRGDRTRSRVPDAEFAEPRHCATDRRADVPVHRHRGQHALLAGSAGGDAGGPCPARRHRAPRYRDARRPRVQDRGRRVLRGVRRAEGRAGIRARGAAHAAGRDLAAERADQRPDGAARGVGRAPRRRLLRSAGQRGCASAVGRLRRTDALERRRWLPHSTMRRQPMRNSRTTATTG